MCYDVVVKRAYRRLSLKVHPDRVGKKEKKSATCKFQILGKVYSILSDKEKRAVYDETGMWVSTATQRSCSEMWNRHFVAVIDVTIYVD